MGRKQHLAAKVRIECAWCKKPLIPLDAPHFFGKIKGTHFVCNECKPEVYRRYRGSIR